MLYCYRERTTRKVHILRQDLLKFSIKSKLKYFKNNIFCQIYGIDSQLTSAHVNFFLKTYHQFLIAWTCDIDDEKKNTF